MKWVWSHSEETQDLFFYYFWVHEWNQRVSLLSKMNWWRIWPEMFLLKNKGGYDFTPEVRSQPPALAFNLFIFPQRTEAGVRQPHYLAASVSEGGGGGWAVTQRTDVQAEQGGRCLYSDPTVADRAGGRGEVRPAGRRATICPRSPATAPVPSGPGRRYVRDKLLIWRQRTSNTTHVCLHLNWCFHITLQSARVSLWILPHFTSSHRLHVNEGETFKVTIKRLLHLVRNTQLFTEISWFINLYKLPPAPGNSDE